MRFKGAMSRDSALELGLTLSTYEYRPAVTKQTRKILSQEHFLHENRTFWEMI